MSKHFMPCPPDVLAAVKAAERKRLGVTSDDEYWWAENVIVGYVENYVSDSVGYVGPVVILLWPADPGAVTIYIQRPIHAPHDAGQWAMCNQTKW